MVKQKCKCGHGRDVHAPNGKRGGDFDGECCVQYRGKDGFIKCCKCYAYAVEDVA